jgi:hypothetical protein
MGRKKVKKTIGFLMTAHAFYFSHGCLSSTGAMYSHSRDLLAQGAQAIQYRPVRLTASIKIFHVVAKGLIKHADHPRSHPSMSPRLYDVLHTEKKLTLVFEFLDSDLKKFLDTYSGDIDVLTIKVRCLSSVDFICRKRFTTVDVWPMRTKLLTLYLHLWFF